MSFNLTTPLTSSKNTAHATQLVYKKIIKIEFRDILFEMVREKLCHNLLHIYRISGFIGESNIWRFVQKTVLASF